MRIYLLLEQCTQAGTVHCVIDQKECIQELDKYEDWGAECESFNTICERYGYQGTALGDCWWVEGTKESLKKDAEIALQKSNNGTAYMMKCYRSILKYLDYVS